MEHAAGGGKESLHSDSIAVPAEFFMDLKGCVRFIDSAMCLHYKEDNKGRAWFRNPDTTVTKIGRHAKPFSAMLANVFMRNDEWVKLVQSHYDNLVDDGGEPPVITEGMMTDYFFNIEGMRTVAFGLVSHDHNRERTKFSNRWKRHSPMLARKRGMHSENALKKRRFEEFSLFMFNIYTTDKAHQSGLGFGRVVFGTGG